VLFEILTEKAVTFQERAALRIGPWLQVPVKPATLHFGWPADFQIPSVRIADKSTELAIRKHIGVTPG
jgi:hypothetical protein